MIQIEHSSPRAFPLDYECLSGVTPADLFARLPDTSSAFWLDSASSQPDKAWSYMGVRPSRRIQVLDAKTVVVDGSTQQGPRAIEFLERLIQDLPHTSAEPSPGPPFRGGWVGYFGFDCLKDSGARKTGIAMPLISLNYFDSFLAYQHRQKQWWVVAPDSATSLEDGRFEMLRSDFLLTHFASDINVVHTSLPRQAVSDFTPAGYCAAVRRALEYIRAGDIYQVNLAQRLTVPWTHPAADLYLRLRRASPAQYGAFLGSALVGNNFSVCSISPELFLQRRGCDVLTRPIKGTRPRGESAAGDARAKRDLAADAKERAELNMIVDLERNDLGRVCEYNSVRVASAGEIEELPTLFHRVATITGRLRADCGAWDLLQAAFPGGSVTGAPKIRALQIVDELERSPREAYCGAIGWIGTNGDLDLSVAIRTVLCDGARGVAHYHAGSGIVADSDPRQEYEETLHKAAAFLRATNATLAQP